MYVFSLSLLGTELLTLQFGRAAFSDDSAELHEVVSMQGVSEDEEDITPNLYQHEDDAEDSNRVGFYR